MITLQEYLENPCAKASLPYWKEKNFSIPNHMKIVHEDEFNNTYLQQYKDVPYFRLYHPMNNIRQMSVANFYIKTASISDIPTIVEIINQSYSDIQVTPAQIEGYIGTQVYCKDLWILVYEAGTNAVVGCGIADFDKEIQEGILEWIQVLPEYRKKGLGSLIVHELLYRMQSIAKFATVSGQVNNRTNPEKLYRKCGFTGRDIWHILYSKSIWDS